MSDQNNLTREQAYQAMLDGKKVTHVYFTDDEFIRIDESNKMLSEDGYSFSDRFWNSHVLATGWSIYNH